MTNGEGLGEGASEGIGEGEGEDVELGWINGLVEAVGVGLSVGDVETLCVSRSDRTGRATQVIVTSLDCVGLIFTSKPVVLTFSIIAKTKVP